MPEQFTLKLVAGAPGAGKSRSAQLCAAAQSRYLAFDMDCLIDSASALVKKDIHTSPETWTPYNALWMDVMEAVLSNGAEAVLFTPLSPSDLIIPPTWCNRIRWLLLDCADEVLIERLRERQWEEDRVRGALVDAEELRSCGIDTTIRTDELDKHAVAEAITLWQATSL